jgi:hypothetical protein
MAARLRQCYRIKLGEQLRGEQLASFAEAEAFAGSLLGQPGASASIWTEGSGGTLAWVGAVTLTDLPTEPRERLYPAGAPARRRPSSLAEQIA